MEGVYRFASPQIKASFGSADNFSMMLNSATFSPLLFHKSHTVEESIMLDNGALLQTIRVVRGLGKIETTYLMTQGYSLSLLIIALMR